MKKYSRVTHDPGYWPEGSIERKWAEVLEKTKFQKWLKKPRKLKKAVIGTRSMRRKAEIKYLKPLPWEVTK
jgi:hypothetical protein